MVQNRIKMMQNQRFWGPLLEVRLLLRQKVCHNSALRMTFRIIFSGFESSQRDLSICGSWACALNRTSDQISRYALRARQAAAGRNQTPRMTRTPKTNKPRLGVGSIHFQGLCVFDRITLRDHAHRDRKRRITPVGQKTPIPPRVKVIMLSWTWIALSSLFCRSKPPFSDAVRRANKRPEKCIPLKWLLSS